MTSAMALPPSPPGYPAQRMAPILGWFCAKEMSMPPPDRITRMIGFGEAAAKCRISFVWFLGRRMSSLSLPSLSM